MSWRLHLTNQAITDLQIISGESSLVVVWLRPNRAHFFDLAHGTQIGDARLEPPDHTDRQGEHWLTFISGLNAPNNSTLPIIRLASITIHTTDDGRMRLYHIGAADLHLDENGREEKLNTDEATEFVSVALDRFLGLIAALDSAGKLHVFQQHIRVGAFDMNVKLTADARAHVAISRGGGSIFVTDGSQLLLTDSSGQARHRTILNYYVRLMACSPNGRYLVTCDIDIGVIRVYDGTDLIPTHQRFAIDLMARATQLQLIADLPPAFVAPNAIAIDDNGVIAFSMSGVICVTDLSQMDALPRPQTLL